MRRAVGGAAYACGIRRAKARDIPQTIVTLLIPSLRPETDRHKITPLRTEI